MDRIEDLQERLHQLEKEHATLNSEYMIMAADFDNFRISKTRDQDDLKTRLTCSTLSEILPVVDNFERARQQLNPEGEEAQELHRSYQGLYKQLVEVLKTLGVTPMLVVDETFDPTFHEAVMREPSDEKAEDIVIEELKRGYYLNDRVLRHAQVKVSMGPDPRASKDDDSWVRGTYQSLLGREADEEGLNYWKGALAGGQSRGDVVANIKRESEYKDKFLGEAYRNLFDRDVDAEGLDYWRKQMEQGQSEDSIISNLKRSDEFVRRQQIPNRINPNSMRDTLSQKDSLGIMHDVYDQTISSKDRNQFEIDLPQALRILGINQVSQIQEYDLDYWHQKKYKEIAISKLSNSEKNDQLILLNSAKEEIDRNTKDFIISFLRTN